MGSGYPIPAGEARAEIFVRGSRFVAVAERADSADAARAVIAAVRAEMPDATHHCYGFVAGFGPSVIEGQGDDGEPSGTAGHPILAVLRGSGLGDVVVVVARTFGGTKLGTGGLVRAYTAAAQAVLAALPRELKVARSRLVARLPLGAYERARRAIAEAGGEILSRTFEASVVVVVAIASDDADGLAAVLGELTRGQAEIAIAPLAG